MKVIDCTQKLINHFLKCDYINDEIIFSLIPEKEDPQSCYAAFTCALDDMEKNQIVVSKSEEIEIGSDDKRKKSVTPEKMKFTTWVLRRPLEHREQVILIDGLTALRVSAVVNNFSQILNKTMMCNVLQITNQDVLALLDIIAIYAKQNINQKEKVEEPKK